MPIGTEPLYSATRTNFQYQDPTVSYGNRQISKARELANQETILDNQEKDELKKTYMGSINPATKKFDPLMFSQKVQNNPNLRYDIKAKVETEMTPGILQAKKDKAWADSKGDMGQYFKNLDGVQRGLGTKEVTEFAKGVSEFKDIENTLLERSAKLWEKDPSPSTYDNIKNIMRVFNHDDLIPNDIAGMDEAVQKWKAPPKEGTEEGIQIFDPVKDEIEYGIANRLVNDDITLAQAQQALPKRGANINLTGSILATAWTIDPKYKPKEQALDYATEGAYRRAFALLQPEIVGAGAKKVAVSQAMKIQQNKVDAFNALMVALPEMDENGKWNEKEVNSMPPTVATELAMASARLISPTGTIAQTQVEELQQGTLAQKISRVLGYYGMASAGTTALNLTNIYKFAQREGRQANKARAQLQKGEMTEILEETGGVEEGGTEEIRSKIINGKKVDFKKGADNKWHPIK